MGEHDFFSEVKINILQKRLKAKERYVSSLKAEVARLRSELKAAEVKRLRERIQLLIDYKREPMGICYDEFAYNRLNNFYKDELRAILDEGAAGRRNDENS